MQIELFIMDRAYSSWSLRGHLALAAFGFEFKTRHAHWPSPEFEELRSDIAPARTVPAMRIDGALVWDSLAIAETLAEIKPEMWPTRHESRTAARSIVAEMHSGFSALRGQCPMNLRRRYNFSPSAAVLADLKRVELLWGYARLHRTEGPYLFGAFSIADVFYAPIASRIDTYGLKTCEEAERYIDTIHRHPDFRRWRAMACANEVYNPDYELDLTKRPGWPGAAPLPARAVEGVTTVNETCPYSGLPVSPDSLAEIDGVAIGYCNQFCRDKSVADPEAWPQTVALLEQFR